MVTISQGLVADVIVQNPLLTEPEDSGKYVTYEVVIKSKCRIFSLPYSSVRRRFSEFQWLRRHLVKHHKFNPPPQLPPRKFFGERFRPARIEERRKGLQHLLNWCFTKITYLSESALHLFVQTSMSVEEIDKIIKGRSKLTPLEAVLKAGEQYEPRSPRSTITSIDRRKRFDHSQSMLVDKQDDLRPCCYSSSINNNEQTIKVSIEYSPSTEEMDNICSNSGQNETHNSGQNETHNSGQNETHNIGQNDTHHESNCDLLSCLKKPCYTQGNIQENSLCSASDDSNIEYLNQNNNDRRSQENNECPSQESNQCLTASRSSAECSSHENSPGLTSNSNSNESTSQENTLSLTSEGGSTECVNQEYCKCSTSDVCPKHSNVCSVCSKVRQKSLTRSDVLLNRSQNHCKICKCKELESSGYNSCPEIAVSDQRNSKNVKNKVKKVCFSPKVTVAHVVCISKSKNSNALKPSQINN